MADFILKFRWFLIVVFILAAFCLTFLIPGTGIQPDIKAMLPEDFPSRLSTETIDKIFGGTEMIMVVLETDDILKESTLKRVKNISKQMKRI
jgi:predicted RND superfamily exporter protein